MKIERNAETPGYVMVLIGISHNEKYRQLQHISDVLADY